MTENVTLPDSADRPDGFTLVELLIVIVILGILAVVTVFAVRGIVDKGEENAEGTDLDTIQTAVDAYWLEHDENPTEAELVSAGYLKEASDLHDVTVAGDGTLTITNVRTGSVVGTGAAGTGGGTPTTTPGPVLQGVATTFGPVPALEYGTPGGRPWVVIGGSVALGE